MSNPIECHFGQKFVLDNSDHTTHTESAPCVGAHLRWRNANARARQRKP